MNRRTVEIAFVAAVAILVVSVAASTLDSTSSPGSGSGFGGENGTGFLPEVSMNVSAESDGGGLPREPMLVIGAVGFLLALWYMAKHPKDAIALVIGTALVFGVVFLVLIFLGDLFGGTPGGNSGGLFGGGARSGESGATGGVLDAQSIELLAILALGIAFVGIVLGVSGGESDPEEEEGPEESPEVDMDAIATTAGRAADRIAADAGVENEVYRAWREMTDLLDVPDPETSTPREFAAAAVDAGMDPEDVDELTVLFEEVRYGARKPTGDREKRAIGALRRIESTYGES